MRYAQYIWPSVNKIPYESPTFGMGGPSQWQTAAMGKLEGVNPPLSHFKVFMGFFKKIFHFIHLHRWIKVTSKNQGTFIVMPSSMTLHSYPPWQGFSVAVFNFLLGFHWCHSNGQTASSKETKATASEWMEKTSHRLVCTKNTSRNRAVQAHHKNLFPCLASPLESLGYFPYEAKSTSQHEHNFNLSFKESC